MLENFIRNQTSTYHSVTALLTLSNLEIQATKVEVWKFSSFGNKCFLRHYPYHSSERYRLIHVYRELRQQIKAELKYMYMILNVSLSPKRKNSDLYLNIVARKCTLGRLKAKAVGQGCACSKNVLKMTFSSVTACVPVTLFLSLENKAYFALRLMSFLCVTKQNVELMKIFLNTDLLLTISQIKIQQRTKEKAKWKR